MPIDIVDRTRELLASTSMSHDEIGYLTGLEKSWINRFERCAETLAPLEEASRIARLHDWLIVLELASGTPRFGPREALLRLGETAVYMYWQRQTTQRSGLLVNNECAAILAMAEARLAQLRMSLPASVQRRLVRQR
jgi:hypothetical protein